LLEDIVQTVSAPTTMPSPPRRRSVAFSLGAVLALAGVTLFWPNAARDGRLTFDPVGLAHIETEGWRAYYDRDWSRAVSLMLQLHHDEFGLNWFDTFVASYHATRAQIAFAGQNNNAPLAQAYLEKYYAVMARARGLRYDPAAAAEAEMRYWIVHRQVASRPDDYTPLVGVLADLHTLVFAVPPDAARASGVERTAAAAAVDRITGRRSTDVAADWREVEARLVAAYTIVAQAMPR
jgi:hypothetical protein